MSQIKTVCLSVCHYWAGGRGLHAGLTDPESVLTPPKICATCATCEELTLAILLGKRLLNHGHTYTATKMTEYLGAGRGVTPPAH